MLLIFVTFITLISRSFSSFSRGIKLSTKFLKTFEEFNLYYKSSVDYFFSLMKSISCFTNIVILYIQNLNHDVPLHYKFNQYLNVKKDYFFVIQIIDLVYVT
jgi:hypothetical protein